MDLGSPPADGGSDASTLESGVSEGGPAEAGLNDWISPPAFCTGTAPRMQINGADVQIMNITRKPVAMNCCVSEELAISLTTFQAMLFLLWDANVSALGPNGGATFDLANAAPPNFNIEFSASCDPLMSVCDMAGLYNFSGTLSFSATPQPNGTTSYCVIGTEKAPSNLTSIQSFAIWVPSN